MGFPMSLQDFANARRERGFEDPKLAYLVELIAIRDDFADILNDMGFVLENGKEVSEDLDYCVTLLNTTIDTLKRVSSNAN